MDRHRSSGWASGGGGSCYYCSAQSYADQSFLGGMGSGTLKAAVLVTAVTHGAPSGPALGARSASVRRKSSVMPVATLVPLWSSGAHAAGRGSIAAAGAGYGYGSWCESRAGVRN